MATCPTCGEAMLTEQPHIHRAGTSATAYRTPNPWPGEEPRPRRDAIPADESPLVWERPHIVSTRTDAAAGTPRPQGWEA